MFVDQQANHNDRQGGDSRQCRLNSKHPRVQEHVAKPQLLEIVREEPITTPPPADNVSTATQTDPVQPENQVLQRSTRVKSRPKSSRALGMNGKTEALEKVLARLRGAVDVNPTASRAERVPTRSAPPREQHYTRLVGARQHVRPQETA